MPVATSILNWWLVIFLGGLLAFPLSFRLFPNCADRGYVYSKIIALAFFSLPIWYLSSFRILPFAASPITLLIIPGLFLLILTFLLLNNPLPNITTRYQALPLILLEELLFSLAFLFWLFVRSQEPSLASLEKPMDFGIINSVLRTDFFPPKDMWLSGFSLNYYYYGHFVVALLIKISGVLPEIGYNLMLATLFALTFTTAFSLGLNFLRQLKLHISVPLFSGLLTAAFVTLFGNLHPIFAYLKGSAGYWYPDATRFIPRTIHEFPLYSFVVADLHGHVLDIPFVLLAIALIFQIWQHLTHSQDLYKPSLRGTSDSEGTKQSRDPSIALRMTEAVRLPRLTDPSIRGVQLAMTGEFLPFILLGVLLGILYMTNSLDAVIYLLLFGFLVLYEILTNKQISLFKTLVNWSKVISIAGVSFLVASLPFLLTFNPFISGIALAPEQSPLWQLLILWGSFLPFIAAFLYYFRRDSSTRTPADIFIAAAGLTAILLIIFPELFYFKDIYTTQPRANTMFKFTYQAFIIFALATPYVFFRLMIFLKTRPVKRFVCFILFSLAIIISGTFPFYAIRGYYGNLGNPTELNGLSFLKRDHPDDYAAVAWLNKNVPGTPVILEAAGESYSEYARVSANTGLPTIFGWSVHEWLWRKSNRYSTERAPDIQQIYSTVSTGEAQKLLNKYKVSYIFVGELERKKYPLSEAKFRDLGEVVYSSGQTQIYKLNH
ncbi:MAG: DUF2298 domain-containing protein [Patescibacteria group bacterium]